VATIEVLNVSFPQTPDELWGMSLDAPREGAEDDVFALALSGWVLGRRSQVSRVEVLYEDRVVQTTEVNEQLQKVTRSHPDLASSFPQVPADTPCGFDTLVGVIGFTPEFELHVVAVLEGESRVHLGSIKVRHEPVRSSFQPRMQPVMVTSPGRTGSTWLMRMLAAHPNVVLYEMYPYETFPAKYWAYALKVLTDPANHAHSSRAHGFDTNPWLIGRNPFFTPGRARDPELLKWFARSYVERLATFLQGTIEDWYLTLARIQGLDEPLYFAEKQLHRPSIPPTLMWELYPEGKELFLVRDFRDMACSKLAFSEKTGHAERQLADTTDEEYVQQLGGMAVTYHRAWKSRGDRAHLVRYEDLVLRPRETVTSLLQYLDLERSPQLVEDILSEAWGATKEFHVHGTSPDLEASVGRWRRHGDESFKTLCQETFGDLLADFGYADLEHAS
jgi:hypothetical protein